MVLVEPDLFFRQLAFHTHKLVLHRATMRGLRRAAARARLRRRVRRDVGARRTSDERLADVLARARGRARSASYDVVDDWLDRDLRAGLPPREVPADRAGDTGLPHLARRDRRDVRRREAAADAALLRAAAPPARPADGRRPAGRRPLELRHREPQAPPEGRRRSPPCRGPTRGDHVRDAIAWVRRGLPRQPGRPGGVPLADHAPAGGELADPLPRGAVRGVRALRGRDRGRRAVAVPLGAQPADQHRSARPAARRRAGRGARRGARRRPAERGGLRAPGDRLARVHAGVVRRARARACGPATCSG